MKEIEVVANYKWWRHPVKYWQDRKKRQLMTLLFNSWWKESGFSDGQMACDISAYGMIVADKDGKRVDPSKLSPTPHPINKEVE